MAASGQKHAETTRGKDRRGTDRRVANLPFKGADKRKGERRSGRDRRADAQG